LAVIEENNQGVCDMNSPPRCVDYSDNIDLADERIVFNAQAGKKYFIFVDGYFNAVSDFDLFIGAADEHLQLHEYSGDALDDFAEVINRSACPINLDPYEIRTRGDCDMSSVSVSFNMGQTAQPGQVWRARENVSPLPPRTRLLPDTCDTGLVGFTMLCDGACDLTNCSNVVDYMSRDDDDTDMVFPGGPSCAGFSPA